MLTIKASLIHNLQTTVPRGVPFDTAELGQLGISPSLAHHYLTAKWLVRLGRGVFMFSNDSLRRDPSIRFLARRIQGLHVGGKTALAWRGVRHNLPTKEPLWLWGNSSTKLPPWFTERFPATYTARNSFTAKLKSDFGLQPLPETPDGPLVSVPERALLEMLGEVGITQGVEEARNIMESVHSVRMEVLEALLKHCRRVKVIRLCVLWAQELKLPWASEARKAAGRKLGRSRWTSKLRDGTTLILKP